MKKNQSPILWDKLPAYFSSSYLVHLVARMIKKITYYSKRKRKNDKNRKKFLQKYHLAIPVYFLNFIW
ncbi:MAG: hypothetical protein ABI761_20335 [Saprospiraceae bacterium]